MQIACNAWLWEDKKDSRSSLNIFQLLPFLTISSVHGSDPSTSSEATDPASFTSSKLMERVMLQEDVLVNDFDTVKSLTFFFFKCLIHTFMYIC